MKGKNVYIIVAAYDIAGMGAGSEIVGVFEKVEDARESLHSTVKEMKETSDIYDEQCEMETKDGWSYNTDEFFYELSIQEKQIK